MKERKHIFFQGDVQGVGFRWRATQLARPLGLTGWVRNLSDGRVEMEVQGEKTAIRKLLVQLKAQRYIRITGMEVTDLRLSETEHAFGVIDYY